MSALVLGLVAAVAWGFHDVCVRFVSQRVPLVTALLWVLLAGLGLQLAVSMARGTMALPTGPAALLAVAAGFCFLLASLGLYGAFQRGPVRLVAPIIASYPVLSVAWAGLQGAQVTALQWVAVLAIVVGVSLVAALSDTDLDRTPAKGRTIFYSVAAACGFAATFALGQAAAQTAGEIEATLIARLVATASLVALICALRRPLWPGARALPLLGMMGLADGVALLCVISAAGYAQAHYAAVAASTFGLLTIVMAWAILREPMRLPQWMGCAITFCGIGYLAL